MKTKLRKLLILIILVLLTFNITITTKAYQFGGAEYIVSETIAEHELAFGIKHRTDIGKSNLVGSKLNDQSVNVLEVPASKDVKVVAWSKLAPTRWNMSPVRVMASDYEMKNPGYRVVAAINGDFFDINGKENLPYATVGIHVSGGENYKTVDNNVGESREPIGFKNDGSIKSLIGNAHYARSSNMILAIYNDKNEIINEFIIAKVNETPEDGEIAIYYGNWINKNVVPVEVENGFIVNEAEYALAYSDNDFYGKGIITSFGNNTIDQGDFAIVSNNPSITNLLKVGVKIRAQYELDGDFKEIEEATGSGRPILYDGNFMPDTSDFGVARHPRTMVGIKADGTIVMTVVDGRQENMSGASQPEMGAILRYYGCVDAYNLDGGGSSTMIILNEGQYEVTNSPSDSRERSDSNCLLVVAKVPEVDFSVSTTNSSFTLNVNLLDLNGYEFTDLYVGVKDEIKKVENGKITFDGLLSNTEYAYTFYYKKDNLYHELVIQKRARTAKLMPTINYISMYYDGANLIVEVDLQNNDNAIERQNLKVDGITNIIINGKVIYYNFTGKLQDIMITLSYDLNDDLGRQEVTLMNLPIKCELPIFMDITINELNKSINGIYN